MDVSQTFQKLEWQAPESFVLDLVSVVMKSVADDPK
jgi:hypothetical protein